jgi:hypothetical protein
VEQTAPAISIAAKIRRGHRRALSVRTRLEKAQGHEQERTASVGRKARAPCDVFIVYTVYDPRACVPSLFAREALRTNRPHPHPSYRARTTTCRAAKDRC